MNSSVRTRQTTWLQSVAEWDWKTATRSRQEKGASEMRVAPLIFSTAFICFYCIICIICHGHCSQLEPHLGPRVLFRYLGLQQVPIFVQGPHFLARYSIELLQYSLTIVNKKLNLAWPIVLLLVEKNILTKYRVLDNLRESPVLGPLVSRSRSLFHLKLGWVPVALKSP